MSEPDTTFAGPTIMSPLAGNLDVIPDTLALEVTAAPADGPAHLATEIEIWRVAGNELVVLAWRVELTDPANMLTATIADGELQGLTASIGFVDWDEYAVRARYRLEGTECADRGNNGFTGTSGCCDQLSAWSTERVFRITDGSPEVFDDTVIRDMAIELSPESFDAINAEATPPGCVPFSREYYVGNAIFDGERFDSVGVRAKGGCGSSRNLDGKTSFKVNLSWDDPAVPGCPETRRHRGLKRMTMNNQIQDRSFTHERVAYHFYRLMGVPVPRVAHVRLSVNGELWGLYLNIETIDRRMLSRNFGSNDGGLYEGTYRCDLEPQNVPPNLEDDYCIQAKFVADECSKEPDVGADPLNYDPIRGLTEDIAALPDGGFYPAITELIDWDRYLSVWAADTLLNHWDGYTYEVINNYRVYHDPSTDLWTVIPTGLDQSLTTREVSPFAPAALLANRCLSEPQCEAAFVARLGEAITVFEQADLGGLATEITTQIRAEVEADPRRESSMQQFDNSQAALQDFIANRPDAVRDYILNR